MPVTQRIVISTALFLCALSAMADQPEATDVGFFSVKARMIQAGCAAESPSVNIQKRLSTEITLTGCPQVSVYMAATAHSEAQPVLTELTRDRLNESNWHLKLPTQSPMTLQINYY